MTNNQKLLSRVESDKPCSSTNTAQRNYKAGIRKLKKEINNTNFRQNYFELRVGEERVRHETKLKDLDETTKDQLKFMSIIKMSRKKQKTSRNQSYNPCEMNSSTSPSSLSPQSINNYLSFPFVSNYSPIPLPYHHNINTSTPTVILPTPLPTDANMSISPSSHTCSTPTSNFTTSQPLSLDRFKTNEEFIQPKDNNNQLPKTGEQECKIECHRGEIKIKMSDSFIEFLQSFQLSTNSNKEESSEWLTFQF